MLTREETQVKNCNCCTSLRHRRVLSYLCLPSIRLQLSRPDPTFPRSAPLFRHSRHARTSLNRGRRMASSPCCRGSLEFEHSENGGSVAGKKSRSGNNSTIVLSPDRISWARVKSCAPRHGLPYLITCWTLSYCQLWRSKRPVTLKYYMKCFVLWYGWFPARDGISLVGKAKGYCFVRRW